MSGNVCYNSDSEKNKVGTKKVTDSDNTEEEDEDIYEPSRDSLSD